jgi:hypothetical protein
MPHRVSRRRLHDDKVRAGIRKHGNKIARKHRIPIALDALVDVKQPIVDEDGES